jgi:hypothetical protein
MSRVSRRGFLGISAALLKTQLKAGISERRLIVAGSENQTNLSVIDLSNPSAPAVIRVDPGFGAGTRVALGDTAVVAGSVLTGAVRWIDLVPSPAPVQRAALQTGFSGIGAIAVRKSLVAVGEYVNTYKARVALIDYSRPEAPVLAGIAQTPLVSMSTAPVKTLAAITNLAFSSELRLLVAGPNDFRVIEIDFTAPGNPLISTFLPRTGPPVIDVDGTRGLVVVGDSGGRLIKIFSATTFDQISTIPTSQASINAVSVSTAGYALAAGSYSFTVDKVDILGQTATSFSPGLSGGLVTAVDDLFGVCGEINGSRIALLDLSGNPRVTGVVHSGLASISTLATGALPAPQAAKTAVLILKPQTISFPMTLFSSSALLTIQNVGGTVLNVRNIRTSDTHFSASPTAVDVPAGETRTISLKFSAVPKTGGYLNALLTMTTNDPLRPTASVALSAVVGLH